MSTLASLQDRRDRLQKAIDAGIRTVAYQEGRQTYRDLDEMYKIRDDLERRVAAAQGKRKRRGVTRLNATKGL